MEVLLVLLAAAIFLVGPLGFFLALSARSRIDQGERKTRALEARIAHLERAALARASAGPAAEPSTDAPQADVVQNLKSAQPAPEAPPEKPIAEAAREAANEPEPAIAQPVS